MYNFCNLKLFMINKILPSALLLSSCAASNPGILMKTPYYPEGAMTCEQAMDISVRVFKALYKDQISCNDLFSPERDVEADPFVRCSYASESISPQFSRFDDEGFISYFRVKNATQHLNVYPDRGSFSGSCPKVFEYLNTNFFFVSSTR